MGARATDERWQMRSSGRSHPLALATEPGLGVSGERTCYRYALVAAVWSIGGFAVVTEISLGVVDLSRALIGAVDDRNLSARRVGLNSAAVSA